MVWHLNYDEAPPAVRGIGNLEGSTGSRKVKRRSMNLQFHAVAALKEDTSRSFSTYVEGREAGRPVSNKTAPTVESRPGLSKCWFQPDYGVVTMTRRKPFAVNPLEPSRLNVRYS